MPFASLVTAYSTDALPKTSEANSLFLSMAFLGCCDMQKELREASLNNFPLATEFQRAKELQTLIPSEMSAAFLAWLLLETQDEEYGQKEWNIYDTSHHARWIENPLPLPINKNKSLSFL